MKVYACCTHPVLSGPAVERIENSQLEEVVVTNTIPLHTRRKCKKIRTLSVGKLWRRPSSRSTMRRPSVVYLFRSFGYGRDSS